MRINKPVGSKDRLVEVFQKVNHVKLNENLLEMGGVGINPENALNMAFNQLKNKKLRIEHSNTQVNGSESYVEIIGTDPQGNNITFTFKTTSQEGDQEGVFKVGQVALHSFSFDSADGEETVELGDEGLKRFNQQHANEMFDVIQDYLDVEPQGAETAEASSELAEAIALIDAIKKDSSPFGGGWDKMQTGKAYADEKPTNDKVRVKSPELDKFINENEQDINPDLQNYLKQLGVFGYKTFNSLMSGNQNVELVLQLNDANGEPIRFKLAKDGSRQFFQGSDREIPRYIQAKFPEIIDMFYQQQPQPVQEDLNALLHTPGTAGAGPLFPQAADLGVTNQYVLRDALKDAGIELLDIVPAEKKDLYWLIFTIDGKKYKGLINRNYGNAAKVVGGIKKRLEGGVENLTPVKEFEQPQIAAMGVGGVVENDEDDIMGQELNRASVELQNPDDVAVEDEPVPDVSPEKRDKILQAYDSLMAKNGRNPNYSPTTPEVMAELDKLAGVKKPTNTRTFPKEAEPYLEEGIRSNPVVVQKLMANLEGIFKQAIFNVSKSLQGQDVLSIDPEKLQQLVSVEAEKIADEKALAIANESSINEEKEKKAKKDTDDNYSPFPQLGKTFKPKSQSLYPKKKKKPQTSVKIAEGLGDEDVVEIYWEKYPYYLKKAGDSTHFYMSNSKEALNNGNAMVSHIGEHQGRPYYNDVRSWLKGGESPNGKDYDDLNNMQSSSTGPMLKANESTDRDKYEDVVFLQGDEAYEPLERLDREGPDAALEYLKQWHYPGEHQGSQVLGHGSEDKTYEKDGYIMSWNPRLDYIGLQYDMSKSAEPAMNEGDENPELNQVEKDNPDLYPPGWKEMDGMFMGPDSPGYGKGGEEELSVSVPQGEMNGENDGMSLEPESDEIEQIAQDKEEAGEMIPGGKGEGKSALEFSPEQILMGMKVEMEHTDDPMYALEITIDHLTEDPEYYTTKDTPENSAQANASADANGGEEGGEDKEMTDVLLGFKPHNVGDEIEGEEEIEEPEEEVPHTPETPEVAKDVQDSEEETPEDLPKKENELGESKTKQSNLITETQIRTAKRTLSNSNVPTGMSKKDAVQILVKHLIK
jgi:hypothetical protein